MRRFSPLLLLLTGCPKEETKPSPEEVCDPVAEQADASPIVPGVPQAGVAEDFLDLPVGLPLSGYTSRCKCFGNDGKADYRDSAYTYSFNPSAGVQTRVPVKAFWLSNGDQDLVIIKMDLIYSNDELVQTISEELSERTGRDLVGKVVVATSHSHASYGDFSDQVTYYLGSDRFNYEIFLRMTEKAVGAAMEAHDSLQPAKIGVGIAKNWDPNDKVYHDRRGDNDQLGFFEDIPKGSYKDPTLSVLRIDTMDDQPLGMLFDFGVHGTTLGGDNPLISVDTPGHVERMLQERFDTPVVVALLQGGAGDASPSNEGPGLGSMERTGEYAADGIMDLWEETPTSADPIRLETATRAVKETHDDIEITRGGTVDLKYTPYTEGLVPDEKVYAEDGSLLSPIDEFNVEHGAAFCGENPAYLPGFAPSQTFPYVDCVNLDQMIKVINGFFDLTEEEARLPLAESTRAQVTASRMGPLPIRDPDGSITSDDFFIGFFPGETTSYYTEQFRRRAATELGYKHSMAVGYSQDHEGYLLIPEDWLTGGYEADINVWGPLQGEHIMEQLLLMAKEDLSTDVVEKHDPCGLYKIPDYGEDTLPTAVPEESPEAGTLVTESPTYLYSPLLSPEELKLGATADLTWYDTVPRVQGMVQFAWIGGDPAVDFPLVTLEHQETDGSWAPVLQPSGRAITGGPDILIGYTPDPLYTYEVSQTHYWFAAWQAIGPEDNRLGLPTGTYRLHVAGQSYGGQAKEWPWDTVPYEVSSPEFTVVPGTLTVVADGNDLRATIDGPARGYRMLDTQLAVNNGALLAENMATLQVNLTDGSHTETSLTGDGTSGATVFAGALNNLPANAVSVTLIDVYGNQGTVELGG